MKNENQQDVLDTLEYKNILTCMEDRKAPINFNLIWGYCRGKTSPARSFQNKIAEEFVPSLKGKTLELGATFKQNYSIHAAKNSEYKITNVNRKEGVYFLNILDMDLPDNSVDNIIAFSVLEHVPFRSKAMQEVFRVLKPGGKFLISIPFMFPVHGAPNDYVRYTPSGLSMLCENFKIIRIEALGNIFSVISLFLQHPYGWNIQLQKIYPLRKYCMIMKSILFRCFGVLFYIASSFQNSSSEYATLYFLILEKEEKI